jgi:Ribosomal protein HS6-type (S12/L30/L7a)
MTKLQSMLGFAAKSRQLVSGSNTVETYLKKNQAYLVICAGDLSPKTINHFSRLCQTKQIPFYCYSSCSDLGHWIGKPGRGVVAVISAHFATTFRSLLKDGGD